MLGPTKLYVGACINKNSACHVFFQNFLGVVTLFTDVGMSCWFLCPVFLYFAVFPEILG
jgi:hypothetical protein